MVGMARIDAAAHGLTVVVTGAECSGKTTLASDLAGRLCVPWVGEYAREYLAERPRYAAEDLVAIGEGQLRAERLVAARSSLVVADTDLLVVRIWSDERFGARDPRLDAAIDALLAGPRHRFYLVPRPEMPWEPDPLREHPHERDRLHALHLTLLAELGLPHLELHGSRQARLEAAASAVAAMLSR
jgi:nicotinamide riboside kinase